MATVTMRTLGQNGRFANQLFQYAFLRFYAREHGFDVQVPAWEGKKLFNTNEPDISKEFAQVVVDTKAQLDASCADAPLRDVDFWGYFQDIDYYCKDIAFFRGLFQPVPRVEQELTSSWQSLHGYDVVGLHMRYGDYGCGYFFETPSSWVIKALDTLWEKLNNPALYIATDDSRVWRLFKRYRPLLLDDVFQNVASCPQYYCDFWALTQANAAMMIANSSFSYCASLLNTRCGTMLRPSLRQKGMVIYSPWSSVVLLREDTPWLRLMSKKTRFCRIYNKLRRLVVFSKPFFRI
ncbi:hypothetical protein IG626_13610 [Desulfovibrio desulfuricans]|uniref:hypothetical protein n=1 Tax=Desulfovibrio desulfuricans TaxID=876 RepID=UPI00177DC282|nr:hypothetical protein [Desulfovibrio desulfuricans]MBD8897034.1 hypothetical protein [Desulfovibrio desulfuricans]